MRDGEVKREGKRGKLRGREGGERQERGKEGKYRGRWVGRDRVVKKWEVVWRLSIDVVME